MKATFESECSWCSERICKGDEIKRVTHQVSKTETWVHEECAFEAMENWGNDYTQEK